jgi:hypothetical protein
MQDNKVYLIDVLSNNTDSTILQVKLQKGFEIKCVPYEDVLDSKSYIGAFMHNEGYHDMTSTTHINALSVDKKSYVKGHNCHGTWDF